MKKTAPAPIPPTKTTKTAKPIKKVSKPVEEVEVNEREPATIDVGNLTRRVKPSYRWIACDVVKEAGPDGNPTDELLGECHKAAKAAGLDPKDDAYWSRRLTRARALLNEAGFGKFTAVRNEKVEETAVTPKAKAKGKVKKVAYVEAEDV